MLKKKFVYDVKRQKRIKKLTVDLSKKEFAKILDSMYNIRHNAI